MARAIPTKSVKTVALGCIMLKIILSSCLLHLVTAVPAVHALPRGSSQGATTSTVSSSAPSTAINTLATIRDVPANDVRVVGEKLNRELLDLRKQLAGRMPLWCQFGCSKVPVVQSDNQPVLTEWNSPHRNGQSPPERTKLLVLARDGGADPAGMQPASSGIHPGRPIDDLEYSTSWGAPVGIKFEPQR